MTPAVLRVLTRICLFVILLLLSLGGNAGEVPDAEELAEGIVSVTREVVEQRLAAFDSSLIDYRTDEAVMRRVTNYIENWPITSGRMLARSARYYPIFEEQLAAAGMPLELKHISIIESALRPWAISPATAGGLWQLMPGTAREHGLIVDEILDERLDPELGCAAGLEYLKIQYERYEDWALALAAYNSGPGRVNRAIRRSGSRNYWKLRRFLPRETRDYVPNFIAALYLMSYHHLHDLPASAMELDLQLTEAITVFRKLSLHRVIQLTGLRPKVVLELNPQYHRGYLPGLPGGHRLRLPTRVIPIVREYLDRHPRDTREEDIDLPWTHPRLDRGETNTDQYYTQFIVAAGSQDTSVRQVAAKMDLPVDQLLIWSNRGELDSLEAYDEFFFFAVERYAVYDPRQRNPPPPAIPLPPTELPKRIRPLPAAPPTFQLLFDPSGS